MNAIINTMTTDTSADALSRTLHPAMPPGKMRAETVLDCLMYDGYIRADEYNIVLSRALAMRAYSHPLAQIAALELKDDAGKSFNLPRLTEWFAGKLGMRSVHIDPLKIDFTRVAETMSDSYARRFSILPIEITPTKLVVATSEPRATDWVREIEQTSRRTIELVFANPVDLERYITEFFSLARNVKKANERGGTLNNQNTFEQLVELGKAGKNFDANDAHIIHIVDWLWQYAFDQRASDIHLEPRRDIAQVRFRIDGVLHNVYQVPPAVMSAMTARIKLLGRMDVVERRRPQDGRVKTKHPNGEEVELRLSTLPTAFGEKLVMRIFDPETMVKDFSALGFPDEDAQRWRTITAKPHGLILVTGPTGSGKTTTLYSTLKMLAQPTVNVSTVEDPIEMVEPAFNQMQVQGAIDLGFAEGLRALMRQDPDIIMVGEIRDQETADMAIQAALTGHLVLSTLHTNDAPSAITRLFDLGVQPFLLSATLIGVLAQRLARTLCPSCKTEQQTADVDTWGRFIAPWRTEQVPTLWHAPGCLECRNTGFRGRVGLYELMVVSEQMRQSISDRAELATLRTQALGTGMRTLRVAGAQKVAAGLTTMEEVMATTPSYAGPNQG